MRISRTTLRRDRRRAQTRLVTRLVEVRPCTTPVAARYRQYDLLRPWTKLREGSAVRMEREGHYHEDNRQAHNKGLEQEQRSYAGPVTTWPRRV